jgi:LPS-assembly protein
VRDAATKMTGKTGPNDPVDLEADNLSHDQSGKIVTASGHVILKQSGRELRADQVVYNMTNDTMTANGHVIFTDANGDVHFAEHVVLTNQMKDGTIEGLKTYLARGGRFTAEDGKRENATLTTMNHVTYTTCDCAEDAHGNAPWQIRARKMVYDETKHRVSYNDATVGVLGVPVFWTPYFSHPDGQIKQKSGFLTPVLGYNSRLGANVTEQYYWGISPSQDLTVGTMAMTNKNPLLLGEYRQRFDNAEIKFNGSVTDSSYADQVGTQTVHKDSTVRSHIFGDGLWDMSDTWRSGFHLALASDDEYLRQYKLNGQNRLLTNNQDVLENELYAERFSGRNYAAVRALAFQDIRSEQDKTVQPSILPEITASFIGEPNETLGGRWDANISALGLTRDGNGQDVDRLSLEGGWQRRMLTGFGLVTTADARVRGDLYRIGDADSTAPGSAPDANTFTSRVYPDLNIVSSYPFAKTMERAQIIVAPEASITVAPNIDPGRDKIPNEDSQDVQLDATNIFQANRFPGYDRVESGSHAAYGLRTGVYGYEGSSGEVFLGQSYSLSDSTIFPRGSGLSQRHSDIVGEVSGNYADHFGVDYRFDLTSDTLASERHEFDGYANFWRFQLSERYLYAKALEDTNIVESRQQLDSNVGFRLTDEWKLRAGAVYDMGQDNGLRRAALSADYLGCCMFLSFTASRNFTTDASESNGTDFTMRIGLKGLGDYPVTNPGQISNSKL